MNTNPPAFPLRTRALTRSFFRGASEDVARRLLGTVLVHATPAGLCAGRIVETEAYLSAGDAASHSFRGATPRNAAMFLAPGHVYLYRIYGVHLCFNIVTAARGQGEAVLVRALEPLIGCELMTNRRATERGKLRDLCSGPGKLTQALGLCLEQDGQRLFGPPASADDPQTGGLRLHAAEPQWQSGRIRARPRVGISQARTARLRFHPAGNPWISAPR